MKMRDDKLFMAKVNIDYESGCWNWTGAKRGRGQIYGALNRYVDGKCKPYMAHRYAYEKFYQPIQNNLQIDHVCLNTLCVNPTHMRLVTQKENILLSNSPTAVNARKSKCIRGHSRWRITTRGSRICMECHRLDESKHKRWRVN